MASVMFALVGSLFLGIAAGIWTNNPLIGMFMAAGIFSTIAAICIIVEHEVENIVKTLKRKPSIVSKNTTRVEGGSQ